MREGGGSRTGPCRDIIVCARRSIRILLNGCRYGQPVVCHKRCQKKGIIVLDEMPAGGGNVAKAIITDHAVVLLSSKFLSRRLIILPELSTD